MDRIIMGDNQFFGVNHMSEEKGMAKAIRFQKTENIIEVIDTAYDCGVRAFTFSTHEKVKDICNHFRANPERYSELHLYPALPYAHKYAHSVNEKGILATIRDVIVADNSASQIINMVTRGGAAAFSQDPIETMKLLIDAEMKIFRGLNVKVVFLQNIVTDLLLGFEFKDLFIAFCEHIQNAYNVRPGFITLNMPRLVDLLEECGIENPVVCSAINKVGFQMNPGKSVYEKNFTNKTVRCDGDVCACSRFTGSARSVGICLSVRQY